MEQQIKLSPDPPGVQAQLRMTQDIIRRMAALGAMLYAKSA